LGSDLLCLLLVHNHHISDRSEQVFHHILPIIPIPNIPYASDSNSRNGPFSTWLFAI
jgi:hypothetical protein